MCQFSGDSISSRKLTNNVCKSNAMRNGNFSETEIGPYLHMQRARNTVGSAIIGLRWVTIDRDSVVSMIRRSEPCTSSE